MLWIRHCFQFNAQREIFQTVTIQKCLYVKLIAIKFKYNLNIIMNCTTCLNRKGLNKCIYIM